MFKSIFQDLKSKENSKITYKLIRNEDITKEVARKEKNHFKIDRIILIIINIVIYSFQFDCVLYIVLNKNIYNLS